jgi:hypothetical protein
MALRGGDHFGDSDADVDHQGSRLQGICDGVQRLDMPLMHPCDGQRRVERGAVRVQAKQGNQDVLERHDPTLPTHYC